MDTSERAWCRDGIARAVSDPNFGCGVSVMKKSIISITFVSAVLFTCLSLQSCAEHETYVGPPYGSGYVTDTYSSYRYPYAYNTYSTDEYPTYDSNTYSYSYPSYYSYPQTQTYYTTRTEPDSIVGSTAHAVGTIIAAPFRLVGDAIGIVL